jgi:hypothetical protein
MPDVRVHLLRRVPFTVTLRGEPWEIAYTYYNKSGKYASLIARCEFDGRTVQLISRNVTEYVWEDVRRGFHVASGTPARGLVTALRRAGVAELSVWRDAWTGGRPQINTR